jgi:hypothetical protein
MGVCMTSRNCRWSMTAHNWQIRNRLPIAAFHLRSDTLPFTVTGTLPFAHNHLTRNSYGTLSHDGMATRIQLQPHLSVVDLARR